MTSDLTEARTLLVELLSSIPDVRVVTRVPKTFTPPLVWITSDAPYRQRAQAVGKKRINLVAVCVGGFSSDATAEDVTEEIAEKVANKIDGANNFLLDPANEIDEFRTLQTAQGQSAVVLAVKVSCETARG